MAKQQVGLFILSKLRLICFAVLLQKEKGPPLLAELFMTLLRLFGYAMCISFVVLMGSAVVRRAAAVSGSSANIGVAAASSPSLPGPGSGMSSYAPKEYIKVRLLEVHLGVTLIASKFIVLLLSGTGGRMPSYSQGVHQGMLQRGI
jgi:hypothetical protein